jgi:hypothetical protein
MRNRLIDLTQQIDLHNDKEIMRNRWIDLNHKKIDLVPLVDLTVYRVDRKLQLNIQKYYQIKFWVKEPFNDKEENSQHYLYRHNEGDAYEIFSILIRLEKDYDEGDAYEIDKAMRLPID